MVTLVDMNMDRHHLLYRIQHGILFKGKCFLEDEPIYLNLSVTVNQFRDIITRILFTVILSS